jgi:hypothetical protein
MMLMNRLRRDAIAAIEQRHRRCETRCRNRCLVLHYHADVSRIASVRTCRLAQI